MYVRNSTRFFHINVLITEGNYVQRHSNESVLKKNKMQNKPLSLYNDRGKAMSYV